MLSTTLLGIAASYLGRLIAEWSIAFAIVTAIVSVLAGLAALFAPSLRGRFSGPRVPNRSSRWGAFVYGLAYTFATVTTGAGPLLLLLTVAAAIGEPMYGAALSLSYGVGRGIPFLLLGLFAGAIGEWVAGAERLRRVAELVSGFALLVIGGYFGWLASTLATS